MNRILTVVSSGSPRETTRSLPTDTYVLHRAIESHLAPTGPCARPGAGAWAWAACISRSPTAPEGETCGLLTDEAAEAQRNESPCGRRAPLRAPVPTGLRKQSLKWQLVRTADPTAHVGNSCHAAATETALLREPTKPLGRRLACYQHVQAARHAGVLSCASPWVTALSSC